MQKKLYDIIIHYPETEEEKIELRNQLGRAYSEFTKEYIWGLQISNEQKEKMYSRLCKQLRNQNKQ